MTRLVLWDIDHTLIAMRGVGTSLFGEAFVRTVGLPMTAQALVDGLTDPVIFRETARLHGIASTREDFERFASHLAELHLTRMREIRERGHALAGAAMALAALAEVPGVRQTVVTGNIRGTAEIKLKVFGLDHAIDWETGAYGEDSDTRPGLVATALRRAAVEDLGSVTLIGDTPADMIGATENGVTAIGIASGRSSEDDLRAGGATHTLPDLADTQALVALVLPNEPIPAGK